MARIVHYETYGNRAQGEGKPGRVITGPLGLLLRKLKITIRS
jgi:hypothetical protein